MRRAKSAAGSSFGLSVVDLVGGESSCVWTDVLRREGRMEKETPPKTQEGVLSTREARSFVETRVRDERRRAPSEEASAPDAPAGSVLDD